MARQFIYHMAGLNKAYGNKKVLENIHLSFYPEAKIGILGPNGAGKSTVLRIMAGLDTEYTGEAWVAEGARVGILDADIYGPSQPLMLGLQGQRPQSPDRKTLEPMEAHNMAEFALSPKGETTDVTWAIYGPMPYLSKVVSIFCSFDSMLGKEFEAGLAELQVLAET